MKKSLFLLGAIGLGILLPQASEYSFLVYYLLMFMLFFPFLGWKISPKILKEKKVYLVLLINILMGVAGYMLLKNVNPTLALIAFLVGITPTATACPAVMGFLKGKVDFAISAVLVTNLFMAFFLPFVIWQISDIQIEIISILTRTLILIFTPLLAGQVIQSLFPNVQKYLLKIKNVGFYAWLLVCFIAVAKASNFIQTSEASFGQLALIGGISAFICVLNFSIGKLIGGKELGLETSQTLGQKNTTLTIWIGITYFSPIIALGPIFYLICHNMYNSYQLALQSESKFTTPIRSLKAKLALK